MMSRVQNAGGSRRSSSSSSGGGGGRGGREPLKSTSSQLMSDRRLSVSGGGGGDGAAASQSEARRCSMFRQFSTVQQPQPAAFSADPAAAAASGSALARWKKVLTLLACASLPTFHSILFCSVRRRSFRGRGLVAWGSQPPPFLSAATLMSGTGYQRMS